LAGIDDDDDDDDNDIDIDAGKRHSSSYNLLMVTIFLKYLG